MITLVLVLQLSTENCSVAVHQTYYQLEVDKGYVSDCEVHVRKDQVEWRGSFRVSILKYGLLK